MGFAFSFATWWVASSYFGVDVPASLMFFGADGWCDPSSEGVGNHCFGDFSERWLIDETQVPPWPNNLELTPVGPFLTGLANSLAAFFPARAVLLLVVVVYSTAVLSPWIWSSRGKRGVEKAVLFSIIGVGSYPFLAVIDRLNSLALVTPIVLGFSLSFLKRNYALACVFLVAASSIKPQLLLLSLALIAVRQVKWTLVSVILVFVVNASLIVGAGRGDLGRLHEYWEASSSYATEFKGLEALPQVNVAFAKAIFVTLQNLQQVLNASFGMSLDISSHFARNATFIGIFFAAILGLILFVRGSRLPRIGVLTIALPVAFLSISTYVAGYYLLFALILAALVLREWNMRSGKTDLRPNDVRPADSFAIFGTGSLGYLSSVTFVSAMCTSLVPLVLPMPVSFGSPFILFEGSRLSLVLPVLSSVLWLLTVIFLVSSILRKNAKREAFL